MKGDNGHVKNTALSRRNLLRASGFALGAALLGTGASAQEGGLETEPHKKMPQKEASYQPQPNKGKKCLICRNFAPPSECHLVDGQINPEGWCKFFLMSWGLPS